MIQGETYPGFTGENPLSSILMFRGESDSPDRDNLTTVKDETEGKQERALLCAVCQTPITTAKERIKKQGKHLHTFFNPTGVVYEIGCFRRAPGCLIYGTPSPEFAWFAGYSWQVVYCRSCQAHLGWKFGGEDEFFGLIVNRLTEN